MTFVKRNLSSWLTVSLLDTAVKIIGALAQARATPEKGDSQCVAERPIVEYQRLVLTSFLRLSIGKYETESKVQTAYGAEIDIISFVLYLFTRGIFYQHRNTVCSKNHSCLNLPGFTCFCLVLLGLLDFVMSRLFLCDFNFQQYVFICSLDLLLLLCFRNISFSKLLPF